LFYNAAPYVYNGEDHWEKLGMETCTQVMKNYDDTCLAPLKQQVNITNNSKSVTCQKGDLITIKIE